MRPIIQFFLRNAYRKEMLAVILLKLAGLFCLWWLFFSHPTESLDVEKLNHHYLLDK